MIGSEQTYKFYQMLCSVQPSPYIQDKVPGLELHTNSNPIDLTGILKAPAKKNYQVRRIEQQPLVGTSLEGRNKKHRSHFKQRCQNVEYEEISLQLLSGNHGRNRTFQKMYPWMDFKAFIVEDKFSNHSSQQVDERNSAVLLDIKPKTLDENAPLILFCMGADQNLGNLGHFLVDLACQLKSEIVAFEFSTPVIDQYLKLSDQLVSQLCAQVFDFVEQTLSQEKKRKIFVFGQREGAITTSLLVSQKSSKISGLILQDAFIYFYQKKGIFNRNCKQTRFLDLFKSLKGISLLMLHGIKGETCPFTHARAIMKNIFSNCHDKCQVLSESRSDQNGLNQFRKSVVYKKGAKKERDSAFIFESYFVECDTNEMRKLKRVQYFSTFNNFLSNVTSFIDEKCEIKSPYILGRGNDANEESSQIMNKTGSSLFFVSRLEPTGKTSNLMLDQIILEQNQNEGNQTRAEDSHSQQSGSHSQDAEVHKEEERPGLYLDLKSDYNSTGKNSYKISTASSEGKVQTPPTTGEDLRNKIASKLKKSRSSFGSLNFTERSTFAIEHMKRRMKELETGLESTDSEGAQEIHLTPTNLVDPRQCCERESSPSITPVIQLKEAI